MQHAAPHKGTTILYWFRSLSTVLSPTENSRIQGIFKAFEWFSSTFQGRFNHQGLFKQALQIQVLFKPVRTLSFINPYHAGNFYRLHSSPIFILLIYRIPVISTYSQDFFFQVKITDTRYYTCSLTISWWLSIMSSNLSHLASKWLSESTPPPATDLSSLFLASACSNRGFTCKNKKWLSRQLTFDRYTDLTQVKMFHRICQTSWWKEIKCEACWAFYHFSETSLINLIKHKHSCSILFIIWH